MKWFIAVFTACSLSFGIQPDKISHLSVSYGLSYTGMHILPKDKKYLSPILTLALGLTKEILDKRFDKKDMLFNVLGVGASIVVFEVD